MYRLYEYKSNVQLARKLKPFIERNSLSFTKKKLVNTKYGNRISVLTSAIINISHLCKNTYSNESQITNIQDCMNHCIVYHLFLSHECIKPSLC